METCVHESIGIFFNMGVSLYLPLVGKYRHLVKIHTSSVNLIVIVQVLFSILLRVHTYSVYSYCYYT